MIDRSEVYQIGERVTIAARRRFNGYRWTVEPAYRCTLIEPDARGGWLAAADNGSCWRYVSARELETGQ